MYNQGMSEINTTLADARKLYAVMEKMDREPDAFPHGLEKALLLTFIEVLESMDRLESRG